MSESIRRSLPRRSNKRKTEEEAKLQDLKKVKHSSSSGSGNVLKDTTTPLSYSFRWIDEGSKLPNGETNHSLLETWIEGKKIIVAVGDTILLRSGETADRESAFVAKVERMWQAPSKKNLPKEYGMHVRARWYFKKMDLQQLKGNFVGPLTKQQLLATITHRDLILSNQYDDNDVLTVLDKCTVVNQRPEEEIPSPDTFPPGLFVSRYSICFGETVGTSIITAYDGANQPWPDEIMNQICPKQDTLTSKDTKIETNDEQKSDSNIPESHVETCFGDQDTDVSLEESGSESSELISGVINLKGKIQIGVEHQISLHLLQSQGKVKTRNPKLIWHKDSGMNSNTQAFLKESSDFLYDYLERKGMLSINPYCPFPQEQTQLFLNEIHLESITLSNLSTGSSMTRPRNRLTRECKIDKLLELFHDCNYNVDVALNTIKSSPQQFVTNWTIGERNRFDSGFRRYSGSLDMIASHSVPSKSLKDIVDYHYRFKIPDQFRIYQEKKRQCAMRMIDIIENRRAEDSSIPNRDDLLRRKGLSGIDQEKSQDWSKISISGITGAVEERRSSAKDLLADIQEAVGIEKLGLICRSIKSTRESSIVDLKLQVEEILQRHPTLVSRFMEFLPKHVR